MFGQKGDEGARGFPGPPGPIGLQVRRFLHCTSSHSHLLLTTGFLVDVKQSRGPFFYLEIRVLSIITILLKHISEL